MTDIKTADAEVVAAMIKYKRAETALKAARKAYKAAAKAAA